ncbi:MAG: hypothetical protein UT41_C0002G0027 [Candidatus Wolfebacteria bacterium GW2011_GWC2_39_22]|uniref:Uncharacterized protein n=1 Tax=Candidatus Wolfebacteria bacterium GW2011_GWC2_39_22 TaxID=1619013 RepID=A0A0G0N9X3_9BACT|nr:MAG: hypothetical protein UT41_C0002G0027 [Candidatus Wolfebacteria bacterium GW2011_GWC2_39_22]
MGDPTEQVPVGHVFSVGQGNESTHQDRSRASSGAQLLDRLARRRIVHPDPDGPVWQLSRTEAVIGSATDDAAVAIAALDHDSLRADRLAIQAIHSNKAITCQHCQH